MKNKAPPPEVTAIHADTGTPMPDRHRKANEAAFRATELARPHLDEARASLEKTIAALSLTVDRGPPITDDAAALSQEIRGTLKDMSERERFDRLRKSIDSGDDVLIAAALSAPALLSGLTPEIIQHAIWLYIRFTLSKFVLTSPMVLNANRRSYLSVFSSAIWKSCVIPTGCS